nr:hypothetical protein GCM10025732_17670 [Glycomyces mayteni]
MRVHGCSSTRTRACVMEGVVSTKCRARRSANASTVPMPSRAKAYAVFFCVSVGRTPVLSPE